MEIKYVNECNEKIPAYIVSKAREMGCINHLYIYKEGEYGGKLPKASVGCSKATRFRNVTNVESMKIPLGDGWVAFKSPSGTGSKSSSESKAEKHTSILCQIEDIFERLYHNKYKTYLTTHTSEYYKEAEKESKRTFYHLEMYTTDPPKSGSNVKDPDIIVVEKDVIQYVIEVKWGYLEDYPSEPTDLKSIFETKELNKIINMIRKSKVCRIKGPYIQNGNKVNGNENNIDFMVHTNTKFLVVSDLSGLRESNLVDFNLIKKQYEDYDNLFSICDIKKDVDTFYSLDALVKENENKGVIFSSDLQKKSEQVFKDGDDERATKFAEELKNHVNKRKWNYLLEPIVYGAKQEYSRILRYFTYFKILWLICLGLEISLLAARDVITGKESIGSMIFLWFFLMGIICGPVYLIQFLWVK